MGLVVAWITIADRGGGVLNRHLEWEKSHM